MEIVSEIIAGEMAPRAAKSVAGQKRANDQSIWGQIAGKQVTVPAVKLEKRLRNGIQWSESDFPDTMGGALPHPVDPGGTGFSTRHIL
jgi:hypothetical protein